MPVDTSGANVALGQLSNLPFGQLIGAPLKAAIEAQAIAADTTINFIKEIGFTENPNTNALSATTVSFSFQGPSGETSVLTVPVLAIMPIPFIEIETLDIAFKAKITASGTSSEAQISSQTKSATGSASASYRGGPFKANLAISGSVSSKKDSVATQTSKYSVEYCYDLTLHAVQPGLPAGLSKILGILESAFTPVPAGQLRLSVDHNSVSLDHTATAPVKATITVTVVSADGNAAAGSTVLANSDSSAVTVPASAITAPITTPSPGIVAQFDLTLVSPAVVGTVAHVTFTLQSGPTPLPPPQIVTVTVT